MKKYTFSGLILSMVLFAGCMDDSALRRSIFIKDPEYAGLPKYSEWGYNTFGAYINDETFSSGDIQAPAVIESNDTSMSFVLTGEKGTDISGKTRMSMTFVIPGFAPENYQDLTFLDDSAINLQLSGCRVLITMGTIQYEADTLTGELLFKRVQNLFVDLNPEEIILSGTFDFNAYLNDHPIHVSHGRFDVGIEPGTFYHEYPYQ